MLLPVILLIVLIGVYPKPFLNKMEASVDKLIKDVEKNAQLQQKKGMPSSELIFKQESTDSSTPQNEQDTMQPADIAMTSKTHKESGE